MYIHIHRYIKGSDFNKYWGYISRGGFGDKVWEWKTSSKRGGVPGSKRHGDLL